MSVGSREFCCPAWFPFSGLPQTPCLGVEAVNGNCCPSCAELLRELM